MINRDLKKYEATPPEDLAGEQYGRIPPGYEYVVEAPEPEEETHLKDYLGRLWRRRVLILFLLLATITVSAYLAWQAIPLYTASAWMRVGVRPPITLPYQEAQGRVEGTIENPVITHMNIMRSRPLTQQIIEKLDYKPTPPHKNRLEMKLSELWRKYYPSKSPSPVATEESVMQMRIASFMKGLSVAPIPDTQILEIQYSSPDPDFSARALNTLCDAYIKYNFQSKFTAYEEAEAWLREKVVDVKDKLTLSEAALNKFIGADGAEYMMLAGNAQDYFKQLEELRVKISGYEDETNRRKADLEKLVSGGFPDEMTRTGGAMVVDQLRSLHAAAEVDYDKIKQELGPRDTSYIAAAAAQACLAQQLTDEKKRLQQNARFEYERADTQLTQLRKTYEAQQTHVVQLTQRLSQYNFLKREVDVNKDMYDSLVRKWDEARIVQGVQPSDVTILQRAVRPLTPLALERGKILMMGLLLGLALSVGIALLLDTLDKTIKKSGDIRRLSGLQTLGVIPKWSQLNAPRGAENQSRPALHDIRLRVNAESFRTLRAALQQLFGSDTPRTLLVASALPGEGKTTIAVNLAVAFAQKGGRVLLIDADLKKPSLQKIFGLKNGRGLTDLLLNHKSDRPPGEYWVNHDLIYPTGVPSLDVLPGGSWISDASGLLESNAMRDLLNALADNYSHIILDSAPVLESADTSVLAPLVDGIVLVARAGATPPRAFLHLSRHLAAVGGRIIGAVMNQSDDGLNQYRGKKYYGSRNGGGAKPGAEAITQAEAVINV